jgi:hypothetical protein
MTSRSNNEVNVSSSLLNNNSVLRNEIEKGMRQLIVRLRKKFDNDSIQTTFVGAIGDREFQRSLFATQEQSARGRKRTNVEQPTIIDNARPKRNRTTTTENDDEESVGTVDENNQMRNTAHLITFFQENINGILENNTTIEEFCEKAIRDIGERAKFLQIVKTLRRGTTATVDVFGPDYQADDYQHFVIRRNGALQTLRAKMVTINGRRF